MRDYFQHARRHEKQGTDPIHGLERPWALYSGGGVTVAAADASQNYISMEAFTSGPADATTFGNSNGTASLASLKGMSLLEFGVYRAWFHFEFTGYTNGEAVEAGEGGEWTSEISQWAFGGQENQDIVRETFSASQNRIHFSHLYFVGGTLFGSPPTLPRFHIPWVQAVGVTSGFDVATASVHIEQLSTDYVTNVPSGSSP